MATEYTTIAVILFKSKTLANGEHPLMLRVTKNRVRKYIAVGLSCNEKDWDEKKNLVKKSHPDKDIMNSIISKALKPYSAKVLEFKNEEKDFTPDVLISEAKNPVKKTTVFDFFDLKIKRLKESKQIGNAKVYNDTQNQIKTFNGEKDFTFSQLDYNFLLKFESHLKSKGLTDNAISVRFRTIRALFNAAIAERYAKQELYPFNQFKISERFSTKTQKRAITKEDIKKVEALTLIEGSVAFEAQQYFLFSYYGQGINFVDMANLKWNNIINDRIFYKRAKTGGELSFKLNHLALAIINYWKPLTKTERESYIFPILNTNIHITPTQKYNRVHKVLTRVNKDLKEIGKDAEIDTPLTSYVARHTFATVLKRSGVSTAIISESMGHQTEAITQTYLKSFENSIIDEAMVNLL
ncbi:site-specific integrase [Mucilaginibacter sp. 10I4]|uniref:site-specific integrase n=1 Tax=Mucilaginibacter sp. 10I4 TaxID=3048580 RepID=UPI002B224A9C|nr:site-specific integrase [Mucilaginibacter sp. 10I4]MEB0260506.1 site-specific integrase [Mucilaginibacter sp. 10I4]